MELDKELVQQCLRRALYEANIQMSCHVFEQMVEAFISEMRLSPEERQERFKHITPAKSLGFFLN